MQTSAVSLIFLAGLCITVEGSGTPFCYDRSHCGPSSAAWGGQCQNGKSQSPLDVPFPTPRSGGIVQRNLVANGFGSQRFVLENNGHTVKLVIRAESKPGFIYGSLLSGFRYILQEIHFHWGSTDVQGSEHTLSGKRFPIEAHLVHYNSDFKDFTEALSSNQRNALAVIGVMFEVAPYDNPALAPIVKALPDVRDKGSSKEIQEMDLLNVFPKAYINQRNFATIMQYNGSLTTPKCNEIVLWNVLYTPSFISKKQLQQFRLVRDSSGEPLVNNFRPLQKVNDRKFFPATVVIEPDKGQKASQDLLAQEAPSYLTPEAPSYLTQEAPVYFAWFGRQRNRPYRLYNQLPMEYMRYK